MVKSFSNRPNWQDHPLPLRSFAIVTTRIHTWSVVFALSEHTLHTQSYMGISNAWMKRRSPVLTSSTCTQRLTMASRAIIQWWQLRQSEVMVRCELYAIMNLLGSLSCHRFIRAQSHCTYEYVRVYFLNSIRRWMANDNSALRYHCTPWYQPSCSGS